MFVLFLCVKKLSNNVIWGYDDGLRAISVLLPRLEGAVGGPRETTQGVGALWLLPVLTLHLSLTVGLWGERGALYIMDMQGSPEQ